MYQITPHGQSTSKSHLNDGRPWPFKPAARIRIPLGAPTRCHCDNVLPAPGRLPLSGRLPDRLLSSCKMIRLPLPPRRWRSFVRAKRAAAPSIANVLSHTFARVFSADEPTSLGRAPEFTMASSMPPERESALQPAGRPVLAVRRRRWRHERQRWRARWTGPVRAPCRAVFDRHPPCGTARRVV